MSDILRASDIMTPELRYVDKTSSIKDAALRMINEGIGALLVTEQNSPIGIITKRDIIWAVMFEKRDPEKDTVEKIMTSPIITISADASLREVIEVMRRNNISHLPVREGDRIIGMISDYDLIETLADLIEYLETKVREE